MLRNCHLLAIAISVAGVGPAYAQEAHGSFFDPPPPSSTPASPGTVPPSQAASAPARTTPAAPTPPATAPMVSVAPTSRQAASAGQKSPPQAGETADRCGSTPTAVLTFARQYYERNGESDIPALLAYDEQLYPDEVEYYGKLFSRMEVLKDKTAYLKRWPTRSYTLSNDADIHCNQAISAYDFTGRVTWSASNPAKPATPVKSGVSLVQLGITVLAPSGTMRIVRESGKVVERYPDRPQ